MPAVRTSRNENALFSSLIARMSHHIGSSPSTLLTTAASEREKNAWHAAGGCGCLRVYNHPNLRRILVGNQQLA